MEFTDDAEIAELLDLGTSVIQELQRAEVKGPQTTGKPKVPPGNTKSLATLWEHETSTQGSALGTPENNTQAPDDNNAGADTPATTDVHRTLDTIDTDTPPEGSKPSSTNSQPGDDLDKALSKLEARAKLGPDRARQVKKGKEIGSSTGTREAASHHMEGSRQSEPGAGSRAQPQGHGDRDTGGSTHSSLEMGDWKSQAGATQSALPLEASPGEKSAHVELAQNPAFYAGNPTDAIMGLTKKVNDLETKLAEVLRLLGILPGIKNEISQLKATVALMSNQIASIQILDPGNAGVKSLNEMKALSKAASIVVAGPGVLPPEVTEGGLIVKDELARPIPIQPQRDSKPKDDPHTSPNDVLAVRAMIDTLVDDEKKRKRLNQALDKAKTKDDVLRVKRQIYNA
uniref:Phosphoprotein n=2 Tax=avian paramyxovirus 2 TaxID=2560313 RepID=F5BH28_9MONO|nr:phosphoprotein [Avian metaavulavirus 2]AEC32074.1 phosphoprotein [Avian metaavulavirus 2]BAW94623.1 phosphoprotein [Avian metaavulavirus 2]BAW94629.1 phosphoprotein [Avian metaavulavirus 2]